LAATLIGVPPRKRRRVKVAPAPIPETLSNPSWTKIALMFALALISGVLMYLLGGLMERYAERKEKEIEEELRELEDSGDLY
jgi:uncharacterized protein involved in exopolysaccharide biosynthesis